MMRPLPEQFVGRITAELGGSAAQALFESLDGASPVAVRMNPFKRGGAFDGRPIGWSRYGLLLDARPSFTFDTAFHGGCYYVQEAGSQFVGHILEATGTGGGRILDMCAAPGGKTTLYSSMVGMEGLVVANEPVRNRAAVLADNVRKWGLGNTVVTCSDPQAFAAAGALFDVVAVDAPCSGEGMFRKDMRAREEWSENNVKMCAARQLKILGDAWQALKPGGVLIYSTCTFNSTENEEVLRIFGSQVGDIVEAESVECPGEWGVECSREGAFQTFRFWPHRTCAEGFFAAVARKGGSADDARLPKMSKKGRSPIADVAGAEIKELSRWAEHPEQMRFGCIGDCVYGWRRSTYDIVKLLSERVNAIYSGVAMGRIYGGRLKPEHALAMYAELRRDAVAVAELSREDALLYLGKREFDVSPLSEGLNLITSEGVALGFAKRIGGRCNNLYPNSLRILRESESD